jgi:4-amino-4-deoxy-L-arabinose transferase-like glycosyltransferase
MDDRGAESAQSLGRRNALILTAYALVLFGWNLGSARTLTIHECYVTEGAREMLQTGDWLVPRLGGEPWLEKPPLAHWVVALTGAVTGRLDEFTCRIPSVMCALLGTLMIASLAARWRGPTFGLLVGLIQMTGCSAITYARVVESDIYLWVLVVAALTVFARRHVEPTGPPRWFDHPIVFFFILGLTQLAKGPMFGAVLVTLPCAAFLLSQPWRSGVRWLLHPVGLAVFVIVSVAWPAFILLHHPEAGQLWWLHTFGRLQGECCNPEPVWYYATTLPWQMLPWTPCMLPALPGSLRRAWREPRSADRFLWLWLVVMTLALSAARGKHHHYLIQALPPCAFWAADGLRKWADLLGRLWRTPVVRFGLAASAAGFTAGIVVWAGKLAGAAVSVEAAFVGVVALVGVFLVGRGCAAANYRAAAAALFGLLAVVYGYIHTVWLDRTDPYLQETVLLRRLATEMGPTDRGYTFRSDPPRALFYTRHQFDPAWMTDQVQPDGRPAYVLSVVTWEAELLKDGCERVAVAPNGVGKWLAKRPPVAVYRTASAGAIAAR